MNPGLGSAELVRARSLRARLVVGFAAIAIATFFMVGGLLYWALARTLASADREEIQGKVELVRHFIEKSVADDTVVTIRHNLDDALLGHGNLRVWTFDQTRRVTYGGQNAPRQAENRINQDFFTVWVEEGVEMLAMRQSVPRGADIGMSEILVALDKRPGQRTLRRFGSMLLLLTGLGTISAIVLSYALIGRSLRSLVRLSRDAGQVSATTLSHRLDVTAIDTELQALALAVNQALDRVETAYQHTEAFNADVAHELRTPLASLITSTEVTLGTLATVDEAREVLIHNLQDLQMLSSMVKDMLFLSNADRGAKARRTTAESVADVARQVLDFHEADFESRGLHGRIEGDASVAIDTPLIKRALSNLLSNASRYAALGTTVTIRIERRPDDSLGLSVQNAGAKVAPETLARIFERFYRVESSRKESQTHHGLGLAIVAAIARMHNGSTFASSRDGFTTVGFTVHSDIRSAPHQDR